MSDSISYRYADNCFFKSINYRNADDMPYTNTMEGKITICEPLTPEVKKEICGSPTIKTKSEESSKGWFYFQKFIDIGTLLSPYVMLYLCKLLPFQKKKKQ